MCDEHRFQWCLTSNSYSFCTRERHYSEKYIPLLYVCIFMFWKRSADAFNCTIHLVCRLLFSSVVRCCFFFLFSLLSIAEIFSNKKKVFRVHGAVVASFFFLMRFGSVEWNNEKWMRKLWDETVFFFQLFLVQKFMRSPMCIWS